VAPTATAFSDQTVSEGILIELGGIVSDPGSADTHTFNWQVVSSNGQVVEDGAPEPLGIVNRAAKECVVVRQSVAVNEGGQPAAVAVFWRWLPGDLAAEFEVIARHGGILLWRVRYAGPALQVSPLRGTPLTSQSAAPDPPYT